MKQRKHLISTHDKALYTMIFLIIVAGLVFLICGLPKQAGGQVVRAKDETLDADSIQGIPVSDHTPEANEVLIFNDDSSYYIPGPQSGSGAYDWADSADVHDGYGLNYNSTDDSLEIDSADIVTWQLWNEAYDSVNTWNNLVNDNRDSSLAFSPKTIEAADSLTAWANLVNDNRDSATTHSPLVNEAKDSLTSWADKVNTVYDWGDHSAQNYLDDDVAGDVDTLDVDDTQFWEYVKDHAGLMMDDGGSGTQTGITVEYQDGTDDVDFTVTDVDSTMILNDGVGAEDIQPGSIGDNEMDYSAVTLPDFDGNGSWKVFYTDGSNNVTELALGADGTYLESNGVDQIPSFTTPGGGGDVTDVIGGDGLVDDGDTGPITVDLFPGWGITIDNDSAIAYATDLDERYYTESEVELLIEDSLDEYLVSSEIMYNDGDTVTGTYVFSGAAFHITSATPDSHFATIGYVDGQAAGLPLADFNDSLDAANYLDSTNLINDGVGGEDIQPNAIGSAEIDETDNYAWTGPHTFTNNTAPNIKNQTDAASVEVLKLEGDAATPADSDEVHMSFFMSDDAEEQTEFARISAKIGDVSDASEFGILILSVGGLGTPQERLRLNTNGVEVNSINTGNGWYEIPFKLNQLAHPNGNAVFTMGTYTLGFSSDQSGWGGLTISNTVADQATRSSLLSLEYTDNGDDDAVYFLGMDNSAADTLFCAQGDGIIRAKSFHVNLGDDADSNVMSTLAIQEEIEDSLNGYWTTAAVQAEIDDSLDEYPLTTDLEDSLDGYFTTGAVQAEIADSLDEYLVTTEIMFNDGDTVTGRYDLGGAELEITNGDNPTTDANGEIAVDNNDDAIEFYMPGESESGLVSGYDSWSFSWNDPETFNDTLIVQKVDALKYPHGVELDQVSIIVRPDASYTLTFQEYSSAWEYQNLVNTLTITSTYYGEDNTFDDNTLDADDILTCYIPSTNVDQIHVQVHFHIKDGN